MTSWRQQTVIDASVQEVWELLCDPDRSPEWSDDVIAVTGAPTPRGQPAASERYIESFA
jgi:uncharacterized protein YndB with AHSA1/START domain